MNANTRESKAEAAAPIGVHSHPVAVKSKRRSAAVKTPLFGRIVSILEQARGNVVRAVNTNMVLAYWLIGREIVNNLQSGDERAEYGKQMLADLSSRLIQRYGSGFSVPNLQNFRKFYLAYSTRVAMGANIQYPAGTKSVEERIQYPLGTKSAEARTPSPTGRELAAAPIPHPTGVESAMREKSSPPGDELPQGFSPNLSWSHYRALMRVENETMARYSVLNDRKQIFASKYMLCLPTEEQLRWEIESERRLREVVVEDRAHE